MARSRGPMLGTRLDRTCRPHGLNLLHTPKPAGEAARHTHPQLKLNPPRRLGVPTTVPNLNSHQTNPQLSTES